MSVTASYVYADANGQPVARIDRIEPGFDGAPKSFLPYLADVNGGFSNKSGLNDVKLPLYHLPEVLAAIAAGHTIYLVEGEGKCDRLRDALRKAGRSDAVTTVAGGANAPLRADHIASLAGAKRVIVLADSDTPGEGAATERAQAIADA